MENQSNVLGGGANQLYFYGNLLPQHGRGGRVPQNGEGGRKGRLFNSVEYTGGRVEAFVQRLFVPLRVVARIEHIVLSIDICIYNYHFVWQRKIDWYSINRRLCVC